VVLVQLLASCPAPPSTTFRALRLGALHVPLLLELARSIIPVPLGSVIIPLVLASAPLTIPLVLCVTTLSGQRLVPVPLLVVLTELKFVPEPGLQLSVEILEKTKPNLVVFLVIAFLTNGALGPLEMEMDLAQPLVPTVLPTCEHEPSLNLPAGVPTQLVLVLSTNKPLLALALTVPALGLLGIVIVMHLAKLHPPIELVL
jgi:hypothetical protein